MKVLLSFALLTLPLSCAAVPKEHQCSKGVSVEYKGIQQMNVWGRENSFASFSLANKAPRDIKLPLDGTYYPLLIHGQYVELQSRLVEGGTWELDTVVLEEFLPPRKWLVIGSGDGTTFFLDVVGPISDKTRSRTHEYRVLVKDASGCEYLTQPFRIDPP